jgi:hypothetical protein
MTKEEKIIAIKAAVARRKSRKKWEKQYVRRKQATEEKNRAKNEEIARLIAVGYMDITTASAKYGLARSTISRRRDRGWIKGLWYEGTWYFTDLEWQGSDSFYKEAKREGCMNMREKAKV